MLVSTVCRALKDPNSPLSNERGDFIGDPKLYESKYYRNRNIFDSNGNLMAISETINIINETNPNFKIEYHGGPISNAQQGDLLYGGGISATRIEGSDPINLSRIFYAYYPGEDDSIYEEMSYIVARSDAEADKLKKDGYSSLQDL